MLFIHDSKHKVLLATILGLLVVLGIGFLLVNPSTSIAPTATTTPEISAVSDYKNTSYLIEGLRIQLQNGVSEIEAAPGSASKITTRYFGNELLTDLNNDGREDIVFLLTQQTGGSGTFYYAVAALNTPQGYIGSDGYFLGDRIAPQTTELSSNRKHKNVVVINYADRALREPMTTQPSVGKSIYLKLDLDTMQWGIVEPDFEGESSSGIRGTVLLGPTCPVVMDPPDPQCADKLYATKLAVTTSDQSRIITEFSSGADGKFSVALEPGQYAIRSAAAANILPYCSHETFEVKANIFTEINILCDSGIR